MLPHHGDDAPLHNDKDIKDTMDGGDEQRAVVMNDGQVAQTMRVASSGPLVCFFFSTFTYFLLTKHITTVFRLDNDSRP